MPRLRIIILDRDRENAAQFRYALWADVPAARQVFYARPGAVSDWKNALAADNTNLANGIVAERVDVISRQPGGTLSQVQADLVTAWTTFQADVNTVNPWVRYGTTWDGTTWVLGGVA